MTSSYQSFSSSSTPTPNNLFNYSPTEKAILEIFNLLVQGEVEVIKKYIPEGYLVKEIFYLNDGSVLVNFSFYSILLPFLPSLSWVMFVKEDTEFAPPLIGNTLEEIERELEKMLN